MKLSSYLFPFFIIISFMFFKDIHAQDLPVKWGDIPISDLEMKSFPQDTNATALILCDYGESYFNDELNIVFNRLLRVKIFTAKGYEWGTKTIVLYTDDNAEYIGDIEGITYSLNDKGEVEKSELKSKDIYKEEVDDNHTRYRFTLPNLKPGCIVEMKYRITSHHFSLMKDWVFQKDEPVRWSEYRLRAPKNIVYLGVTRGFEPFAINETEEVTQVFSGAAQSYLGKQLVPCYQMHWAVKDVPAIRDEPFVTTTEDYMNRVSVQLAAYSLSGTGPQKVLEDWDKLVKELMDSKYFYKMIDDTRQVRKLAEQITAGLTNPEEKMKAIYDWVAKSIVWSGRNRVFADQEVNDVLDTKKGSNSEITFLLLSLLKSVGIEGDPLVLSTRANGKIQDVYPIISQFNYVLARVNIGQNFYLLDATDSQRPWDMLPVKVLNVAGLIIKEKGWGWTTVTSEKRNLKYSLAELNLKDDGSVKGVFEEIFKEYASLQQRQNLKDKKDADFAKELFETERSGISVDSVTISGKDSVSSPINVKAWFSSPAYAQVNGDLIYINPHIINRRWENPLKSKNRRFPIDFAYRSGSTTVVTITIPDSFEVKEMFKDISLSAAAGKVVYSRRIKAEGHQIQMMVKMEIKENEIKPVYYEDLKELYAQMSASEAEQLVLKKISKPVEPTLQTAAPVQTAKPEQKNTTEQKITKEKRRNEKRKS
ncbi:MAG: transglutaminase domain-containing protein [Ignavibacteriales bacterium]